MNTSAIDFLNTVIQEAVDLGWITSNDLSFDDHGQQARVLVEAMKRIDVDIEQLRENEGNAQQDSLRKAAINVRLGEQTLLTLSALEKIAVSDDLVFARLHARAAVAACRSGA